MDQIPPPNFSWHNYPFPEDVEAAYKRLKAFIDVEGPFDGIWGFSQGGSLAALLLLIHQELNPGYSNWPFKMALFTSTFLPYRLDSGVITWDLTENDQLQATYQPGAFDASEGRKDIDWTQDPRTILDWGLMRRVQEQFDFPARLLLKYRPQDISEKIDLPSVHVRGLKDPYFFVDDGVSELFDPNTTSKMTHRGGHDFPGYPDEIVHLAELIIETAAFVA